MSVIPIELTLQYINEARTNPKQFAKYIRKELDSFIDDSTLPLMPGCNYSTNQGKKAWQQAYVFLLKRFPQEPFILNEGLNLAAQDHAIDMAKTGIFGHNSSNGASFSDRIQKRCGPDSRYGKYGENIGSDFKVQGRNHALSTVTGLIIDDGVQSRGHRNNIFSKEFKYIGISSRVQNDKIITVMDFHSANVNLSNKGKNSSDAGNQLQYQQKGSSPRGGSGGFGNQGGSGGFGSFGNNPGFGNQGGWQVSTGNNGGGGRYIVSQSTNTSSSTRNGVTKTVKTTKITYSDGSEETNVEQSTR